MKRNLQLGFVLSVLGGNVRLVSNKILSAVDQLLLSLFCFLFAKFERIKSEISHPNPHPPAHQTFFVVLSARLCLLSYVLRFSLFFCLKTTSL